MKIWLILLILSAVIAVLEGITLKNLMRECQELKVEKELLEDIIADRFAEHEESIARRAFPYRMIPDHEKRGQDNGRGEE